MMISQMLKNQKYFVETYGVYWYIIRGVQNCCKTCRAKRLRERRYNRGKFEENSRQAPNTDLLQRFQSRKLSILHCKLRLRLKKCLDNRFKPSWIKRERTALLQKDKAKGNIASNYAHITCLSLILNLLSCVITDQNMDIRDQHKFLP